MVGGANVAFRRKYRSILRLGGTKDGQLNLCEIIGSSRRYYNRLRDVLQLFKNMPPIADALLEGLTENCIPLIESNITDQNDFAYSNLTHLW